MVVLASQKSEEQNQIKESAWHKVGAQKKKYPKMTPPRATTRNTLKTIKKKSFLLNKC